MIYYKLIIDVIRYTQSKVKQKYKINHDTPLVIELRSRV